MEKRLHLLPQRNSRALILIVAAIFGTEFNLSAEISARDVKVIRAPEGGIQPQLAMGKDGVLHLLYFKGEARQGDLFYVRSTDEGATFSTPIRVNSQQGSAIAAGTIRGGQIAIGRNGRVHVAWNGSGNTRPGGAAAHTDADHKHSQHERPVHEERSSNPMLYARLNDAGTAFEPQRNLMTRTFGLDGGGTVAADDAGHVYVAWHGKSSSAIKGEGGRQIFVTKSNDDGTTFAPEQPAWDKQTGACGCCGMRMFADSFGKMHILYRSATDEVHRDIYLLSASSATNPFEGTLLHPWEINACPMSSMSFAQGNKMVLAAWETAGQVYYAKGSGSQPVAAANEPAKRKHPVLATNDKGTVLLAWNEGAGWGKGGTLSWRLFDAAGKPLSEIQSVGPAPTWSFAAVAGRRDGGFIVIY